VARLNVGQYGDLNNLSCQLEARADGIVAVRATLELMVGEGRGFVHMPITLTGVHNSPTPWKAAVPCSDANGLGEDQGIVWYDIQIIATQVAHVDSRHL
jgi:hypothetical protein